MTDVIPFSAAKMDKTNIKHSVGGGAHGAWLLENVCKCTRKGKKVAHQVEKQSQLSQAKRMLLGIKPKNPSHVETKMY